MCCVSELHSIEYPTAKFQMCNYTIVKRQTLCNKPVKIAIIELSVYRTDNS